MNINLNLIQKPVFKKDCSLPVKWELLYSRFLDGLDNCRNIGSRVLIFFEDSPERLRVPQESLLDMFLNPMLEAGCRVMQYYLDGG